MPLAPPDSSSSTTTTVADGGDKAAGGAGHRLPESVALLFARLVGAELPDGMRRRAVRIAGGLAEEGGREFLLGIQASVAPSGKGLEAGFVVALVQALGGEAARPILEE